MSHKISGNSGGPLQLFPSGWAQYGYHFMCYNFGKNDFTSGRLDAYKWNFKHILNLPTNQST